MAHDHQGSSHWNAIFADKAPEQTSWFEQHPVRSLRLIEEHQSVPGALIDVGAGTSRLLDELLDRGWNDLSALDISAEALEVLRGRLGSKVTYLITDIRDFRPTRTYDVWHDRAVLHFLTNDDDRHGYVATCASALAPGGHAVIGAFAPNGPATCSGLPVRHYGPRDFLKLFSPQFELVASEATTHVTPWGSDQAFTWVVLRRR